MELPHNFMDWPDDKKGLLFWTIATDFWFSTYLLNEPRDEYDMPDALFGALQEKLGCSEDALRETSSVLLEIIKSEPWRCLMTYDRRDPRGFFIQFTLLEGNGK
jgi:hypothetical protein